MTPIQTAVLMRSLSKAHARTQCSGGDVIYRNTHTDYEYVPRYIDLVERTPWPVYVERSSQTSRKSVFRSLCMMMISANVLIPAPTWEQCVALALTKPQESK